MGGSANVGWRMMFGLVAASVDETGSVAAMRDFEFGICANVGCV